MGECFFAKWNWLYEITWELSFPAFVLDLEKNWILILGNLILSKNKNLILSKIRMPKKEEECSHP